MQNGNTGKDLYAAIKYNNEIENFSLNRTITDEELKNNPSKLQAYMKEVRKALNDTLPMLKKSHKNITAAAIKHSFLEHNKVLIG